MALTNSEGEMAILGIVATIWMGYLGTRSIKDELHKPSKSEEPSNISA